MKLLSNSLYFSKYFWLSESSTLYLKYLSKMFVSCFTINSLLPQKFSFLSFIASNASSMKTKQKYFGVIKHVAFFLLMSISFLAFFKNILIREGGKRCIKKCNRSSTVFSMPGRIIYFPIIWYLPYS